MILKGLKRRSNQNFLTKNCDAFSHNTLKQVPEQIRSVLFITDEYPELEGLITKFRTLFKSEFCTITPLVFSEKTGGKSTEEFLFSERHFGWNGKLKEGYLKEVLTNKYDLLINQCKIENLHTDLVVLQAKAGLKVGFGPLEKTHYDLLIQCNSAETALCLDELKKYLEILK